VAQNGATQTLEMRTVWQKRAIAVGLGLIVLLSIGCGGKPDSAEDPGKQDTATPPPKEDTGPSGEPRFELTSPTILHRAAIPAVHTCDGEGTSPELTWSDPPEGTKSFVVIVTDPDVPGNFTHWTLYNIPVDRRSLPAGLPAGDVLAEVGGARQGKNGFEKNGWGAPCPPPGPPHRYIIRLYAIDAELDLPPGADRIAVEDAMKGHVRAQAALIGSYARAGA
jgi:hypothetical protein